MKLTKVFTALAFSLSTLVSINAQTSDKGFSFQGYAIDPDGKAMAGTGVTVQFTLTATGGATFTEEHQVTTDGFGVFHAIIGNSSPTKKTEFSKLDFTKNGDDYTLKVDVKKTSGGTYTTISNEPLLAVPYARKAENGVPVGTMVAFAGPSNNVPSGWLLCNGSAVSKTTYAQLYAVLSNTWGESGGNFNLPDTRGRFLRGVDGGIARDEDRASRTASAAGGLSGDNVGTVQADATAQPKGTAFNGTTSSNGSHSHSYNDVIFMEHTGTTQAYNNEIGSSGSDNDNESHERARTTGTEPNHNHTVSVSSGGDSETRPENVTVFYIIKY